MDDKGVEALDVQVTTAEAVWCVDVLKKKCRMTDLSIRCSKLGHPMESELLIKALPGKSRHIFMVSSLRF